MSTLAHPSENTCAAYTLGVGIISDPAPPDGTGTCSLNEDGTVSLTAVSTANCGLKCDANYNGAVQPLLCSNDGAFVSQQVIREKNPLDSESSLRYIINFIISLEPTTQPPTTRLPDYPTT